MKRIHSHAAPYSNGPALSSSCRANPCGVIVNDVHSRLNPTRVARETLVSSSEELAATVQRCAEEGRALSVAGGRNAMGGQAFLSAAELIDTRSMKHVLDFHPVERWIEVEAGIQWRELVEATRALDDVALAVGEPPLGIVQKQTGADRMTLGGSLSANVHGRGLSLAPIASQVRALTLVDAEGNLRRCDRERNSELFGLVLGGYGLFGAIASMKLDLSPRVELCRRVVLGYTDSLMEAFEERLAAGFTYGDFQFAVDPGSDDFLHKGVFSCYQPVLQDGLPRSEQRHLNGEQWKHLLHLAHIDKGRAFEEYSNYYLRTDGQRYCSDTHQLATYLDGYHAELDAELGHEGSEVISELHIPRERFAEFMARAAEFLREARADVIYGTVRLIERDSDSFLAWAREPWACTVLNLHVEHEPQAIEAAGDHFRGLYEIALDLGGSFYLTYHSWATKSQLLRGHPRLPEFLKAKQRFDPEGRFRSDWHGKLLKTFSREDKLRVWDS